MPRQTIQRQLTFVCLLGVFASCDSSAEECRPLSPETADRLAEYVHNKFSFPAGTIITAGEAEPVDNTCFRKIHFRTEGPARAVDIPLFLSPDQRFLSRELMDATVDPGEQQRSAQQRLAAELVEGAFPMRGASDATVTITLFSDFQCPYCRQEAANLSPEALASLDARVVFRNLPLAIHPWARRAAEMAACVYRQSNAAFWDLHDAIYRNQPQLTSENVNRWIEDVVRKSPDVDLKAYEECVGRHDTAPTVDQDVGFANSHKINGTPTLFINGVRYDGVASPSQLQALVEHLRTAGR
jgi:protein-disulfide isomerase